MRIGKRECCQKSPMHLQNGSSAHPAYRSIPYSVCCGYTGLRRKAPGPVLFSRCDQLPKLFERFYASFHFAAQFKTSVFTKLGVAFPPRVSV